MSELTEQRIASLLQNVQLDAEHRTRLEQCLRERCDRERERLMGLGYDAHHAEVMALAALPDPWDFGAPFELTNTTAKVLLVCVVMAAAFVLIIFLYRVFEQLRVEPASWMYSVLFVAACEVVWMHRLTNRVDLRGGLLIRRWFRPPVHIAMDTIRSVRRNGWHLGGRPTWVVLVYDGGKLRLPWILHGLHGALLALDVAHPGRVEECLIQELQPATSNLRPLSRRRQIVFSMPWLIALLAMAWHARLIWTLETWPVIAVVVFIVAAFAGLIMLHCVRDKQTTIAGYLLSCWVSLVFAAGTWGFLIGQWGWVRGALVVGICSPLMALAFLWSRGRRGALLLTSTVLMVLAVAAVVWSTPRDPLPILQVTPVPSLIMQTTYVDQHSLAVLDFMGQRDQLQILGRGKSISRHTLPPGTYHLLPAPPDARLLFWAVPHDREAPRQVPKSPQNAPKRSYFCLDKHDQVVPFAPAYLRPEDMIPPDFISSPWSPDGRFVALLSFPLDTAATTHTFLRVLDRRTSVCVFEDPSIRPQAMVWTKAGKLRIVAATGEQPALCLHLLELDPETHHVESMGKYQLEPHAKWKILAGLQYIYIASGLIELSTGKCYQVPGVISVEDDGQFAWDANQQRIAVAAREGEDATEHGAPMRAIEIHDPQTGMIARHPFAHPQQVAWMRFSPDGSQLIYTRRLVQSWLGKFDVFSSPKTELWDISEGRITQLAAQVAASSAPFMSLNFAAPGFPPLWTPDGRGLLLNRYRFRDHRIEGELIVVPLPLSRE